MSGAICLQGGAEFGRACRDMDREVVASAPLGPLVILPAAGAPGHDYAQAGRNGLRYYGQWVGDDAVVAPDPREDVAACIELLDRATIVVLPGGSPRRLLDALSGGVADALLRRHADGATISGASAGAMVLCARTLVPEEGSHLRDGLGLVTGLALPHYDGEDRWAHSLPDDLVRWGLPECGGILLQDGDVRAVGADGAAVIVGGVARSVPSTATDVAELLSV